MTTHEAGSLRQDAARLRRCMIIATVFTLIPWLLKTIETIYALDFVQYGIHPGTINGLAGILSAPLIHGSWAHLSANTAALLILGTALLYGYPRATRIVLPTVYLGTGILVWLFARPVYHIGASGLTFGMMFFISTIGILRRDKQAIALTLTVLFLYGGMLGGLFPETTGISFETHIAAACLGILLAFPCKSLDPPPQRAPYSWELEEDDQEELELNEFDEESTIKQDDDPR